MDIRFERTRQMLVDAFEKLQENKSVEEITVSEICELSTVRRATFYRHFEDKYDFYEYYLSTLTDRFLAQAEGMLQADDGEGNERETSGSSLRAYIEHMHRQLIEFIEEHPSMTKNALGRTAVAGTLDLMMNQIAEGIVQRIDVEAARCGLKLELPSELLAITYAGGMVHGLRWWLFKGKPVSKDELVENTTNLLLSYLEQLGCFSDEYAIPSN